MIPTVIMKPSSFLLRMFTFTLSAVTGKSFFKFLTSLSDQPLLLSYSQSERIHLSTSYDGKYLKLRCIPGGEKLLFGKGKLLIDGTNFPEGDAGPKAKVRAEDKSTTRLEFLHKGTVPIVVVGTACQNHGVDHWAEFRIKGKGLAGAEKVGLQSLKLPLVRAEINLPGTLHMGDGYRLHPAHLKAQATCKAVGGGGAACYFFRTCVNMICFLDRYLVQLYERQCPITRSLKEARQKPLPNAVLPKTAKGRRVDNDVLHQPWHNFSVRKLVNKLEVASQHITSIVKWVT